MTERTGRVCHHCCADIGALERVGRRDMCLHCGADLHCCLNCRFYATGHHNDCLETQAERQVEKTVGNFCEHFSFRAGVEAGAAEPGKDARGKLAELFKKK